MQNSNNDSSKATGQMNGSGAGVSKDVVAGAPSLSNSMKAQAAVKGAVDTCRYYDSDGSDLSDDGEVRAKGDGKSHRAGVPYPTQPGSPRYPAHYPNPQTQNQGGQQQQPARGQPRPSTQAQQQPTYAQRPQPTRGYQGGHFVPAPHTAQQQQQPRPSYAPPPPGAQSHVGNPHTGGYPQAGHPQAPAASRYPGAGQR